MKALNEVTVKVAMDDGKDYLNAVELPARTVAANLAGQPVEVQQRARGLVRAAIDGKLRPAGTSSLMRMEA